MCCSISAADISSYAHSLLVVMNLGPTFMDFPCALCDPESHCFIFSPLFSYILLFLLLVMNSSLQDTMDFSPSSRFQMPWYWEFTSIGSLQLGRIGSDQAAGPPFRQFRPGLRSRISKLLDLPPRVCYCHAPRGESGEG